MGCGSWCQLETVGWLVGWFVGRYKLTVNVAVVVSALVLPFEIIGKE